MAQLKLAKKYSLSLRTQFRKHGDKEEADPYAGITSALQKVAPNMPAIMQVVFQPLPDEWWKDPSRLKVLQGKSPSWLKKWRLSRW
jgi:hypothetical protein